MPEEKAKKNTGLIIGIACGAVAVVTAIIVVLVIVLGNNGPKGTYTLTGMQDKDGNDMSSLISLMSLGGATPSIEFKDGGKCDVSGMSSGVSVDEDGNATQKETKAECSYTKDTITTVENGEKSEMKFTVDGDKVIVTEEGQKMIFTKK